MAKKLDLELLETTIIQLIKDNLTAKLTEIDTEKNDGLTLDPIPDANYFRTFEEEINNVNEFIYYGHDVRVTTGIGPASKQEFTFMILVFFSTMNNETSDENRKKSFRYTRAIKEIIHSNYGNISGVSTLKITDLEPPDMQINENSPLLKSAGIELSSSIA